jgi:hypothetical protein
MTTIIYNNGELIADSRISFPQARQGEVKRRDDFVKIRTSERFIYKGEMVQAYAISGDAVAYTFFEFFEKYCGDHNHMVDLLDESLYVVLIEKKIVFNMLVVTENHVGIVSLDEALKLCHQPFVKQARVAIGNGVLKIRRLLFSSTMTPRALIKLASMKDKFTGGTITSWTATTGIKTGEPMISYWELMKITFQNDIAFIKYLFTTKKAAI